jgi:hypothetical protein
MTEPDKAPTPAIFISYRRSDAGGHARALHRDLCQRFDAAAVFFDRDSIEAGDDFPERLRLGIEGAKVVLALIAPDWLEVKGADGRRRLDDPNDFVRHEIARALQLGRKVIPVLFDDTPMPSKGSLPYELAELSERHEHRFGGPTYDYDSQLAALIEVMAKVPGVPAPLLAARDKALKVIDFASHCEIVRQKDEIIRAQREIISAYSSSIMAAGVGEGPEPTLTNSPRTLDLLNERRASEDAMDAQQRLASDDGASFLPVCGSPSPRQLLKASVHEEELSKLIIQAEKHYRDGNFNEAARCYAELVGQRQR